MTQKSWLEPVLIEVSAEMREAVGGHPLVVQTLVRRGITTPQAAREFLDPDAYPSASPNELPGLEGLVERLARAVTTGEPVLVWGDFDVDGQTATSLLVSGLSKVKAQVDYYIPNRAGEGHGVQLEALRRRLDSASMNDHGVLLTCDTGITAHAAVEYAQSRGVDVLVSDHHELPAMLPQARSITNPRFLPDTHPLSSLPGVGVAYKIIEALFSALGLPGEQEQFLDLAALGIIADVAKLRGEARWLVQRGLAAMHQSLRPGLAALLEVARVNPANLSEEHLAFEVAPRLNAIGRLGDANPAVELLTTQDVGQARVLAQQLESYNQERRLLTRQVLQGALALIEREPDLIRPAALVLYQPSWPGGVLGIVASKLVERYGKPALLLSGAPGDLARGSARSVTGINLTQALTGCAHLLNSYGGHAMAAGMSLDVERLAEFRLALSRAIQAQGEIPEPSLQIDAYLDLGELSLELAADQERLAPFGAGNPTLVFAQSDMRLSEVTTMGKGEHLRLQVTDQSGSTYSLVWWQGADHELPEGAFDLAYSIRASTYRGQRQLQIEWLDHRPAVQSALEITRPVEVAGDFRSAAQPLARLRPLLELDQVQVWAEGSGLARLQELGVPARSRQELEPCIHLAIWTSPPSADVLRETLGRVSPQYVYLFNVPPGDEDVSAFLQHLAGMARLCPQPLRRAAQPDSHGGCPGSNRERCTCRSGLAVRTRLAGMAGKQRWKPPTPSGWSDGRKG